MKSVSCVVYLSLAGIFSVVVGQAIPRKWFKTGRFPFGSFFWERGGAVYELLGIKRWKRKVPDMSRYIFKMVPKRLPQKAEAQTIEQLIQETCVAEAVHTGLIFVGFGCLAIWPGSGGLSFAFVWTLIGNMPFIMIQRYNRPRLKKLSAHFRIEKERTIAAGTEKAEEPYRLDVKYGRRA